MYRIVKNRLARCEWIDQRDQSLYRQIYVEGSICSCAGVGSTLVSISSCNPAAQIIRFIFFDTINQTWLIIINMYLSLSEPSLHVWNFRARVIIKID